MHKLNVSFSFPLFYRLIISKICSTKLRHIIGFLATVSDSVSAKLDQNCTIWKSIICHFNIEKILIFFGINETNQTNGIDKDGEQLDD